MVVADTPLTRASLGGAHAPENRIVHALSGTSFYNLDAGQLADRRSGGLAASQSQPLGVIPKGAKYRRILYLQHVLTRQDGLLIWQKFPSYRIGANVVIATSLASFVYTIGLCASMALPKKN